MHEEPNDVSYINVAIGSVAVILNTFSIIVLICLLISPRVPKPAYMYLLNLASADLAVGVTVIGCILTTTYTSLFSIVWYMADRYCFLRHEIYYEVWVTVLLTSIIIFLTWFLSAMFAFLPLRWDARHKASCTYTSEARGAAMSCLSALGIVGVATSLVVCGFLFFKYLKSKGGSTTSIPRSVRSRSRLSYGTPTRPGILRKTVLVSIQLSSIWMPFLLACFIQGFMNSADKNSGFVETIEGPLIGCVYLNSIINPLIYHWLHFGFYKFVVNKFVIPDMTY